MSSSGGLFTRKGTFQGIVGDPVSLVQEGIVFKFFCPVVFYTTIMAVGSREELFFNLVFTGQKRRQWSSSEDSLKGKKGSYLSSAALFSLGVTWAVEDLFDEEHVLLLFIRMIVCAEGIFQDVYGGLPSVKGVFTGVKATRFSAQEEDHSCEKFFFIRMRVMVFCPTGILWLKTFFLLMASKSTGKEDIVFMRKIITPKKTITKKRRRDSSVEDLFRGWPKDRAESQIHCYCGGISNKEKPPWQRPTTPSTTPSPSRAPATPTST